MHTKLEKFSSALEELYLEQYKFNSGGCSKAAYIFYKYLKNIEGVKIKGGMVINRWSGLSKKSITNTTKDVHSVIEYCNHVVLVFSYENCQYIVDAELGVMLKQDYLFSARHRRNITGYLKPKLLKRINQSKVGWNPTFNVYNLKHLRDFLKGYDFNG